MFGHEKAYEKCPLQNVFNFVIPHYAGPTRAGNTHAWMISVAIGFGNDLCIRRSYMIHLSTNTNDPHITDNGNIYRY